MKSPLRWLRESLSPTVRQDSPKDIAAARKAEAEKGQSSVFDSLIPVAEEGAEQGDAISKPRAKYSEVRRMLHVLHASISTVYAAQILYGQLQNLTSKAQYAGTSNCRPAN